MERDTLMCVQFSHNSVKGRESEREEWHILDEEEGEEEKEKKRWLRIDAFLDSGFFFFPHDSTLRFFGEDPFLSQWQSPLGLGRVMWQAFSEDTNCTCDAARGRRCVWTRTKRSKWRADVVLRSRALLCTSADGMTLRKRKSEGQTTTSLTLQWKGTHIQGLPYSL